MSSRPLDLEVKNSSWRRITLENACVFIKDGTHGTHIRVNSGIPLLSAKNISSTGTVDWDSEDSLISEEDYSKIHAKYELEQDDLLLTVVGTLGRRALVSKGKKYTIQRSVAALRLNHAITLPKFLFQFVASDYFQRQLVLRSNATAQAGVYLGELARIQIPVPSMDEQQKIASILTAVDEVIESTQAQINKLKDLKTGMMQELLTKGIGRDGQPHTEFKDSPVGRIPKDWKIVELEKLCSWMGVGIATSTTQAYTSREKGVPILRNQNILAGTIDSSDLLYISGEFSEQNKSKKIRARDVITIRTGYPGKSAVVTSDFDGAHTFTTLISRPNPNLLDSDFLALTINSDYGMNFVAGGQAGGAQQNLNVAVLKEFPVKLPPLFEQRHIFDLVSSISQKISLAELKRRKYEEMKAALMQDLLTGRVRVNS